MTNQQKDPKNEHDDRDKDPPGSSSPASEANASRQEVVVISHGSPKLFLAHYCVFGAPETRLGASASTTHLKGMEPQQGSGLRPSVREPFGGSGLDCPGGSDLG